MLDISHYTKIVTITQIFYNISTLRYNYLKRILRGNMVLNILIALFAFVFGFLCAFLVVKNKFNKEILDLKVTNAKLEEGILASEKNNKTSDDIFAKLKDEFKNIANQALIDNQNQLLKQNSTSIEEKLKPLDEAIKRYQHEVGEFKLSNAKDNSSLKTEIARLIENTKEAQDVTRNLTLALTENRNKKGEYGEDTLQILLDSCGMQENVHYVKHFATHSINADGNNRAVYPDFVLNLPDNKNIVIDSKLNLTSYLRYIEAENQADKDEQLKNFKSDIKNTIKDLAKKNYAAADGINSPDFIFMYIPLESSLSVIYNDNALVHFALDNNIILIGNISLLATLRLVKMLLAQEKQNESALEIASLGASLYDKFYAFSQDLLSIQKKFKDTDAEFTKALNRFTRGEDSLFKTTEKLKTLGITSSKEIPAELLEEVPVEA